MLRRLPFVVAASGCSFYGSQNDWSSQLEPSGPCYEVNLADGVSRESTAELHALFACINQQGAIDPLDRFDLALDASTRSGTVATNLLDAAAAAAGASEGLSLSGAIDAALALFDDREALDSYLRLALELTYAAPVDQLGTAVSINSSTSLSAGILVPLLDVASQVSTAILDNDLVPLAPIADAMRSPLTTRLAWTLVLSPDAPDADLAYAAHHWPALVANLLDVTTDTSNDRNPGPTGDSVRDLLAVALAEDALVSVGGAARPLLDDSFTRAQLAGWLLDEDAAGRLQQLDDGVLYLAEVDPTGGSLDDGEDSALFALLRLFRNGNQAVDCSIDLGVTTLDFSLGNLSVSILTNLATVDPDSASSGVDLLGDAVGYPLTEAILDAVADSGVCPVIDAQLVADLESIDRLSDPATDDLLRSLLGFLDATDDHIPEVVDVASAIYDHGLVLPTEELVRDIADSAVADASLAALPALVDPDGRQATDSFPAGVDPFDFEAICELALAATDPDSAEALSPVITASIAQSSAWEAAHNARSLLLQSDTQTSRLLLTARDLLESSPELVFLSDLADRIEDPALVVPLLELGESTAVGAAITDTELTREGALPWFARLYVGGTITVILDTLTLFRELVPT